MSENDLEDVGTLHAALDHDLNHATVDVDANIDADAGAGVSAATLGGLDRRTLLSGFTGLMAAGLVACAKPAAAPGTASSSPSSSSSSGSNATAAFVPVLVALADRLVPSDDLGPGAREAEVGAFFSRVFADQRLSTVHPLLKRGCAFVMKVAQREHASAFVDLDGAARDDIIRRLVDNQMRPDGFTGPVFVRMVMALTLEGLLGDPRHGGNANGVGWKMVGFSPDGRSQGLALKVLP